MTEQPKVAVGERRVRPVVDPRPSGAFGRRRRVCARFAPQSSLSSVDSSCVTGAKLMPQMATRASRSAARAPSSSPRRSDVWSARAISDRPDAPQIHPAKRATANPAAIPKPSFAIVPVAKRKASARQRPRYPRFCITGSAASRYWYPASPPPSGLTTDLQ